jgi:hypothetical protein
LLHDAGLYAEQDPDCFADHESGVALQGSKTPSCGEKFDLPLTIIVHRIAPISLASVKEPCPLCQKWDCGLSFRMASSFRALNCGLDTLNLRVDRAI